MSKRIILSIASDIGTALAKRWRDAGHTVIGTTREDVDFIDNDSIHRWYCRNLRAVKHWDVLVVCTGTMEPIGPFRDVPLHCWEDGVRVNLLGPLRMLRHLLENVNPEGAAVVFFAGSGNAGPAPNYSSYVVSKIALVKAAEQLHAEEPNIRFSVLGPGPVITKIHQQTINAGERAGKNLQRVERILTNQEPATSMYRVLDWVDWILSQPREVVGGRNFTCNDPIGPELINELRQREHMYKLRRNSDIWGPYNSEA